MPTELSGLEIAKSDMQNEHPDRTYMCVLHLKKTPRRNIKFKKWIILFAYNSATVKLPINKGAGL